MLAHRATPKRRHFVCVTPWAEENSSAGAKRAITSSTTKRKRVSVRVSLNHKAVSKASGKVGLPSCAINTQLNRSDVH